MVRNDGFDYSERIAPQAGGVALLAYLTARYPHASPAEWSRRIDSGQVLIDALAARAETPLEAGQTLVWRRPPWDEPETPLGFSVLYEDADLLAVGKPAGLPTLPGAGFLHATLLHQVRSKAPDASPVHRLGRFTSGIVIFAHSALARVAVTRQLAARQMFKRYRALASGDPEWDERDIDVPIGRVPYPPLGTVHAVSASGRSASSRVTVLERRGAAFLCDVVIATGRPHQIRIHLAAVGHPLVGDPLYAAGGAPREDGRSLPGDGGYTLHASEVRLMHPATGAALSIDCEPPAELRTRAESSLTP